MDLNFNDQMRIFLEKVGLESSCCVEYGICGQQFGPDIIFDALGQVVSTRFKF